ncbi:HutD/Ves family protein [Limobrevibacterium gyesilva]|uniref:HutD family protein n=1 Tax=Limobrevibacterium gyesilva TaxID=2991712 RepID=A0AA41YQD1_9PROT|nr:HutD family protein [Limobrevibacterium gyesilva]MCW3476353.1 HutD family protein [Limobrevibacterium gyesilva]
MSVALIPHASLAVIPWRNGAGRKADIATGPGWQVGYAWLDQDAPFSDYAGHDRIITLIDGRGFELRFPTHTLAVRQLHRPAAFDGGWPTQCRILGGPCMVLNAMTERARHTGGVRVIEAADMQGVDAADTEALFLVVLRGQLGVTAGGATVAAGPRDALRITGPATLTGDATLAVIRIAPA